MLSAKEILSLRRRHISHSDMFEISGRYHPNTTAKLLNHTASQLTACINQPHTHTHTHTHTLSLCKQQMMQQIICLGLAAKPKFQNCPTFWTCRSQWNTRKLYITSSTVVLQYEPTWQLDVHNPVRRRSLNRRTIRHAAFCTVDAAPCALSQSSHRAHAHHTYSLLLLPFDSTGSAPFQSAPVITASSFFTAGPYQSEPSRPTSSNNKRTALYYFWPQMFISLGHHNTKLYDSINLLAPIIQPRWMFCRCGIPMNIDKLIKLFVLTHTHTCCYTCSTLRRA